MATWMTTGLAAAVRSVGEAETAVVNGARLIALPAGAADIARAAATGWPNVAIIAEARDDDEARMLGACGVTWLAVAPDFAVPSARGAHVGHVARIPLASAEDAAMWTGLRARGFAAATPEPGHSGRLTDSWSMTALSAFATRCRAQGLAFGFGGGLEAPDAPRLMAFKPRWILFDEALRAEGALSPDKLRSVAALFHDGGDAAATRKTLERVFLRDLVVDMSIGVYDRERKRKQPARFTVEVDLAPVEGETSFADVFTYDVIIDHIRALAAHGHHDLVETLADDVARAALGHKRARAVRVVVEKLAVIEGAVGVEVRREKQ
ncbi:MAG: dihydroneopterin aldolase [Rhodoblastus sp.]|nr:MAG: dihydroneopterin aldolase [Rhodoblastus sp.]